MFEFKIKRKKYESEVIYAVKDCLIYYLSSDKRMMAVIGPLMDAETPPDVTPSLEEGGCPDEAEETSNEQ